MHDYKIPIGPQHSSIKEPICLRVSLDGNYIKNARIRMGYIHRGVEKIFEKKTLDQAVYVSERTCGICSFQHSSCFVNAIEKILNYKPPKIVKYYRTIMLELERIHSHLLWFAFSMHEVGYETLFNYAMREREYILEIFEKLSGNRIHHGFNKIKTIQYTAEQDDKEFILKRLEKVMKKIPFYIGMVRKNRVIRARLKNVGTISKDLAKKFGLVGPMARGSGIQMDVRKDEPYEAYNEVDFEVITETAGDALARTLVRLREIEQSIAIIRQLIKNMPVQKIPKFTPTTIKQGQAYARVEAPRGENFHFYVIENNKIKRGRIKTPTFNNVQVITELLLDREIGDIPVIVSSLDPCFGCMERVIVIKGNKKEDLSENEFRCKYC